MIINWLDNRSRELTDELVTDSFIHYVIESIVKQGPEYSISTYPNWIEDLDEDNADNAGVIRETLKKHWNAFLEMNLEDLREHLHMPPQKIHGRDVTLEGKMWFSEKLTTVDENGKKVSLKELDAPQRKKVIKEFTDQKKKELDEKVASGDILDYQKKEWIVDKTGKISFWYLESFGMKL